MALWALFEQGIIAGFALKQYTVIGTIVWHTNIIQVHSPNLCCIFWITPWGSRNNLSLVSDKLQLDHKLTRVFEDLPFPQKAPWFPIFLSSYVFSFSEPQNPSTSNFFLQTPNSFCGTHSLRKNHIFTSLPYTWVLHQADTLTLQFPILELLNETF